MLVEFSTRTRKGKVKHHTETISLEGFTLQEVVDVQSVVTPEDLDRFMSGKVTPSVLRAVIWAKLKKLGHKIKVEDFDVDFGELMAWMPDPEAEPLSKEDALTAAMALLPPETLKRLADQQEADKAKE